MSTGVVVEVPAEGSRLKLWAMSVYAELAVAGVVGGSVIPDLSVFPAVALAYDREQALRKGAQLAGQYANPQEGWVNHRIRVMEVPLDMIHEVAVADTFVEFSGDAEPLDPSVLTLEEVGSVMSGAIDVSFGDIGLEV